MSVLIVSPHFDDAVLSCWIVLEEHVDAKIATVFTAGPADPTLVTWWDRLSGVTSQERMAQRALENRAALATIGRESVELGCLESQYGLVDQDQVVAAIASAVEGAEVVYLPAGVAARVSQVNSEHVLVRDVGLALRPDALLYADQPYSLFRGGLELPQGLRYRFGAAEDLLLTSEQKTRKSAAIARYAGELKNLSDTFGGIDLTNPLTLPRETLWRPVRAPGSR